MKFYDIKFNIFKKKKMNIKNIKTYTFDYILCTI